MGRLGPIMEWMFKAQERPKTKTRSKTTVWWVYVTVETTKSGANLQTTAEGRPWDYDCSSHGGREIKSRHVRLLRKCHPLVCVCDSVLKSMNETNRSEWPEIAS